MKCTFVFLVALMSFASIVRGQGGPAVNDSVFGWMSLDEFANVTVSSCDDELTVIVRNEAYSKAKLFFIVGGGPGGGSWGYVHISPFGPLDSIRPGDSLLLHVSWDWYDGRSCDGALIAIGTGSNAKTGIHSIMLTLHLRQQSEVATIPEAIPAAFAALQLPDAIHFNFPVHSEAAIIRIFDLLGRERDAIQIAPGSESYEYDASHLTPGMYLAMLGGSAVKFVVW